MVREINKKILLCCTWLLSFVMHGFSQDQKLVRLLIQQDAPARVAFGTARLENALKKVGYKVVHSSRLDGSFRGTTMVIGQLNNELVNKAGSAWGLNLTGQPGKEGFVISSKGDKQVLIGGADASGALYGCMELSERILANGKIPAGISTTDQPRMVLRGACVGLQKPYYLPGRTVYEYPYTPETFPWFYNKELWIQYLDSLVENRMNSLYLWNGHPFASLVRTREYPYAVEVDDATFKKNEEMFEFLTREADRRGIWVIQMFYNIIVSKPFAEKHGIKTQERERPIIPLVADYTRKSIAAFVEKYPNTGLMVCLGEAMEGVGQDDIDWFTKTIIPGVQDGLKVLGKKEEPPIVLRAHDTDAPAVMQAALPLYKNLYTVAKFNGEALTTPRPRGAWAALHQKLGSLGSVHINNVHILANLEPFRYGSINFIQQSVKGMHEVMSSNGLHLYPQASYWDWPYTADSVQGKRLLQVERDWIWYRAWSRYAWNENREREKEIEYWAGLLAARFGCGIDQGKSILEAYEQSGEIAPKLLRRFGITDGNRQTLTLGMLMTQLINPFRYGLFTLLYESESPEGEMLIEFAEKEWKGNSHTGETPVQIIREVKEHGARAVAAMEKAAKHVKADRAEFDRLLNDMYCYQALANHFAEKAEAALHVLRYKYSGDIKDLEKALPLLEKSVESYRRLATLTKGTYLYANSMQTQQRKIPIRGVDGTFKRWTEVLKPFESELAIFRHRLDSIKTNPAKATQELLLLKPAEVKLEAVQWQRFSLDSGAVAFIDRTNPVLSFARELRGMNGIILSGEKQIREGTEISFTSPAPVHVLVGYFKPMQAAFTRDTVYLKAPELETNASANDYGQADTKIANAIVIRDLPPVNIHSYTFGKGSHTLRLEKGMAMLVGFTDGTQALPSYDAGLSEGGTNKEIDWLFE